MTRPADYKDPAEYTDGELREAYRQARPPSGSDGWRLALRDEIVQRWVEQETPGAGEQ